MTAERFCSFKSNYVPYIVEVKETRGAGSNLGPPLHWECGVLATGPPGKSLYECLRLNITL